MKNLNIVITGSAGFIGSSILSKLLTKKFKITATDKKPIDFFKKWALHDVTHSAIKNCQLSYISGDIRDQDFCKSLFKDKNILIHQAALISVEESKRLPELYYDVNVIGYKNLVDAALESGVKRIIYASSSAASDPNSSPYGKTKILNEEYSRKIALHNNEVMFTGLRYYNVVGKNIHWVNNSQSVLAKWIKEAKNDATITVYGGGGQIRDFFSIDDVVRANILSFLRTDINKNRILEVGSRTGLSINSLAEKFKFYFDKKYSSQKKISIIKKTHNNTEAKYSVANRQDCKDFLGFQVSNDLDKILSNLIDSV